MTDRELMQAALSALENVKKYDEENLYGLDSDINALRARLEQPEQDHVALLDSDGFPWSLEGVKWRSTPDTYQPLYTHPKQPLTDEQIDALELPPSGTATVRDLVRLIEKAHSIGAAV